MHISKLLAPVRGAPACFVLGPSPKPSVRQWVAAYSQQVSGRHTALPSEGVQELVLNHRTLLTQLSTLKCNIAGVSFEGRQEAVKKLTRFQPLLLVPEPSNRYDNKAVAVTTLEGAPLGYIPKTYNHLLYKQGLMPAVVLGLGQVQTPDDPEGGLFGATIWTSSSSVPLLPEPLPRAITSPDSPIHQQIQTLVASKPIPPNQTCEMTGVRGTSACPLTYMPRWVLDREQRQAKLVRLVAVTAPLEEAMGFLTMTPGTPEYQQAISLIRQFNNWAITESVDYVDRYLSWAHTQQDNMDKEEWTVSLEDVQ